MLNKEFVVKRFHSIQVYLRRIQIIRRLASQRQKAYFYRAESEKFESVRRSIHDRLAFESGRYAS